MESAANLGDLMERYRLLMLEISERAKSIEQVLNGNTGLHGPLAREFCFLQLRMICECLALACVTAHGEREEAQAPKFQNEGYADKLMRALEGLNPNFYPRPVYIRPLSGTVHIEDVTEPFLTREDAPKLYHRCSDALHRGKLRNYAFIPSPEKMQADISFIKESTRKLSRLVAEHAIHLAPYNDLILCMIVDEPSNPVLVYKASAPRQSSTSHPNQAE